MSEGRREEGRKEKEEAFCSSPVLPADDKKTGTKMKSAVHGTTPAFTERKKKKKDGERERGSRGRSGQSRGGAWHSDEEEEDERENERISQERCGRCRRKEIFVFFFGIGFDQSCKSPAGRDRGTHARATKKGRKRREENPNVTHWRRESRRIRKRRKKKEKNETKTGKAAQELVSAGDCER